MKFRNICAVISAVILLTSCARGTTATDGAEYSETVFAMDTVMDLRACGDNAEEAVLKAKTEITHLDAILSRGSENSEIYAINTNGSARVSAETAEIVRTAADISAVTGGSFDITIAPVMDLWGFFTKDFRVPSDAELKGALDRVDYHNMTVDGEIVSLTGGAQIDLGGIAKGYLSGKIMDIFRDNGITSGIVSLGGNVHCLGAKPDNSPWKVAVQSPDNDGYLGILSVSDAAVITSGGYQRYFEQGGRIYHHIIDPTTGMSAESGLKSVTVVSSDSTRADALSTAIFVMGLERAADFRREHKDFDMVLLTSDNRLFITDGLRNIFESDYEYGVIE